VMRFTFPCRISGSSALKLDCFVLQDEKITRHTIAENAMSLVMVEYMVD